MNRSPPPTRVLLTERTQAGLRRARAEVIRRLAAGESVSAVARALGTSRQTVTRVRDAAVGEGAS